MFSSQKVHTIPGSCLFAIIMFFLSYESMFTSDPIHYFRDKRRAPDHRTGCREAPRRPRMLSSVLIILRRFCGRGGLCIGMLG
ncbi:hypothetical protein BV20DRAFT_570755 [Pilatotrama ljubarskyi]|nr:hypothetical protein BV20DRAFT_570755 [Pilatotrama ljubarskyi]